MMTEPVKDKSKMNPREHHKEAAERMKKPMSIIRKAAKNHKEISKWYDSSDHMSPSHQDQVNSRKAR